MKLTRGQAHELRWFCRNVAGVRTDFYEVMDRTLAFDARLKRLEKTCDTIEKFFNQPTEESEMQKPTIGRIVHYQKYGTPGGEHKSTPSAAVITEVLNEETLECQLFVMNKNGLYFNATPYSESPKPGHWNWPPKV